ncbi:recombinase family protein [Natrinema altunense]|uniref:Recombinase family protein n=1 Tax=Natrinema altunense TaxID=222984 RepID=A0A482XYZ4_9EURY|nr:recombinase family protein [Natrinema altunense]RZH69258.1 recombinase family protein [Natrinema altunense]
MNPETTAVYDRTSTEDQEDEHHQDDLRGWLDDQGLRIGDVDVYRETASGAAADRDEFNSLLEAIQNGEYENVVVWEISRIARKGFLAQKFFDSCEDQETTIHVVNGSVRRIEPDGHGRLVADIIASVAAEERRQLIRRTKSGVRAARKAGKWVGNVPKGFETSDEGYLQPNLNPDYDAGEVGYLDMVEALEQLEDDESYRKVANDVPNVTRQTLSNIHQGDRANWYLDGEADDERVSEALEEV